MDPIMCVVLALLAIVIGVIVVRKIAAGRDDDRDGLGGRGGGHGQTRND